MKINTSWSQDDWNKALKKVWELSRNFEEILEFGLEHGFITNADIIHASDMYKDPNKIYDEDDIKDFIKDVPFSDLMKAIQDEYDLYDILDELPKNEILDEFDKDDLLDKLDGSWELDAHDNEIKEQVYKEYVDEWVEEMKARDKEYIENLWNANGDDLHTLICDTIGCGYYDQEGLMKGLKRLKKEKLNKNTYGIKYEE